MKKTIHAVEHTLNDGKAKQRFARLQDESHAQVQTIEHTPIYDLNAYYQRKRQLQRKQRFKNFIDGFTFLCVAVLTFSMLFLGK